MSGSGTSDVPDRQVLLLASLKQEPGEWISEYISGVSLGTPNVVGEIQVLVLHPLEDGHQMRSPGRIVNTSQGASCQLLVWYRTDLAR